MSIRLLAVLTTLAFLGLSGSAAAHPCPNPGDGHKHCLTEPPETDGPAQYTAVLTSDAFEFAPSKLEGLTANSRGTALSGDFAIGMAQVEPVAIYLVDQVAPVESSYIFNYHCKNLVDPGPAGFSVMAGNWSINYIEQKKGPGHVYIEMRNLEVFDPDSGETVNANFDFDLHGDVSNIEQNPFPPDDVSVFHLTHYKLWAGVGGRGGFVCNSDGRPGLDPEITLTITRKSVGSATGEHN
jgi:hypothetical protein